MEDKGQLAKDLWEIMLVSKDGHKEKYQGTNGSGSHGCSTLRASQETSTGEAVGAWVTHTKTQWSTLHSTHDLGSPATKDYSGSDNNISRQL